MKKTRTVLLWLMVAVIASPGTQWTWEKVFMWSDIANAQEDWKNEFEEVCSKTQDAMIFSVDELRNLVSRCDKLKPRIEKLDETQKKVYLKRLQLCRDLLFFVLESKEKE